MHSLEFLGVYDEMIYALPVAFQFQAHKGSVYFSIHQTFGGYVKKTTRGNRCQKQCRGGVAFDIASIHILRVGRIAVMDLMLDIFLCGDESGLGKLLVVA